MKKILWMLLAIVLLLGAIFVVLYFFKNSELLSKEIIRQSLLQIISGLIIAIASFWSAYGLYKIQDKQKAEDVRMDSFIKICNEMQENRLTLGMEIKKEKSIVRLPLKTMAWNTGKYQTPIKTPMLLDGLKILYDYIEKYNWNVNFLCHKIMNKGLTMEKVPDNSWISINTITEELLSKLIEFEKLTVREAVILKLTSLKEYESKFGKYETDVKIPYFSSSKD